MADIFLAKTMIHRKNHDLAFTSFAVKDQQSSKYIKTPGYFNLCSTMLQQFDQIEVVVDNPKEKLYLKFLVKNVDTENKIVEVILIEEIDLLEETED